MGRLLYAVGRSQGLHRNAGACRRGLQRSQGVGQEGYRQRGAGWQVLVRPNDTRVRLSDLARSALCGCPAANCVTQSGDVKDYVTDAERAKEAPAKPTAQAQ